MKVSKSHYCILDLETTIRNAVGGNKGSPFCPDNRIVIGQFRWYDSMGEVDRFYDYTASSLINTDIIKDVFKFPVLVGHNIKFDLLWIRQYYNELYLEWIANGGTVWDTQTVEYLITGQEHKYPSLNQVSEKYGGTQKDDKIKEYWNNDIDTVDIPISELLEYLNGDINNTELVFEKQYEIVEEMGMLPLVISQMDALLALVEIEYNGIKPDQVALIDIAHDIQKEVSRLEEDAENIMTGILPKNMDVKKITPASPKQLSTVFFGGYVDVVCEEEMIGADGLPIKFKSGKRKGQVKTKKTKDTVHVAGLGLKPYGQAGKNGCYSTDEEVLQKIAASTTLIASSFAKLLLKHRILSKDLNTYYIGLLKLIHPDGYIHPNYNQCATSTGRLSSSAPNSQNFSNRKEDD